MKDFLLGLWFVWQAVTAPFYPDPSTQVTDARSWLEKHVRVGDHLGAPLLKDIVAEGFTARQVEAWEQREIAAYRPWNTLPASRLYRCEKSIPSRPSFAVTDIRAWLAVDAHNVIIHREIAVLRTSL